MSVGTCSKCGRIVNIDGNNIVEQHDHNGVECKGSKKAPRGKLSVHP